MLAALVIKNDVYCRILYAAMPLFVPSGDRVCPGVSALAGEAEGRPFAWRASC